MAFLLGMAAPIPLVADWRSDDGSGVETCVGAACASGGGTGGLLGLAIMFGSGTGLAYVSLLPEYKAGTPRSMSVGLRTGWLGGLLLSGSLGASTMGIYNAGLLGAVSGTAVGAIAGETLHPSYDTIAFIETASLCGLWGGIIATRGDEYDARQAARASFWGMSTAVGASATLAGFGLSPPAGVTWLATLGMFSGGGIGMAASDGRLAPIVGSAVGAGLGGVLAWALSSGRSRSTATFTDLVPVVSTNQLGLAGRF